MRLRRASTSRRVRAALALALLVDVAVLGTNVYLLSNRSRTTQVDLADALIEFRSGADDVAGAASSQAHLPLDAGPAPVAGTTALPAEVSTTAGGAVVPTTEATSGPTTAPPPPAVHFTPPAPGVYEYRTTGGESISVLGARHDYPATTYAVVRHIGGCGWEIRAEVVEEHVDHRRMCSDATSIAQLTQGREVEFFGTTDGGTFDCTPPQVQHAVGEVEGATSTTDCGDGKGTSARLSRRTLGFGQAVVGGVTVEVVRIRIDGVMTGRVRGTSTDLLTLVITTGLPVRWERSVDSIADAFGTSVRYREQAQFDLVSLMPAT